MSQGRGYFRARTDSAPAPDTVKADTAKPDSQSARQELDILLDIKKPEKKPDSVKSKGYIYFKADTVAKVRSKLLGKQAVTRKESPISNVFTLNTLAIKKQAAPPRAAGDTYTTVFERPYKLPNDSRVKISIMKGEKRLRLLADENQEKGEHFIYWDGTDEAGKKVKVDVACWVLFTLKNGNQKRLEYDIKFRRQP